MLNANDAVVNPNARSTYQKYGKRPIRYSAEYYAWRDAVLKNNENEIRRTHQAWLKRMQIQASEFQAEAA